jgi:Tfp pilus assembly protein PilO
MQQHRIISILSVLSMVVIVAIGWFLIAQPQLAAATSADQQRTEVAAQVAASQIVVAQLKADSEKLPELLDELDELRTSIPAGVDPSGYLDGLSALAQVAGVQITGLTVEDPVAYVAATPPIGQAAPAETETDGEDTGESVEAPPTVFPGIVTSPLIDSSDFVAIPVTIEIAGEASAIMRFINGLQSGDRLFLVSTFTTEQSTEPGHLIGKVGGYIWAIPTGVPGDPRPVSTIVKTMTPPAPPVVEGEAETDGEPDPDPTETPAP